MCTGVCTHVCKVYVHICVQVYMYTHIYMCVVHVCASVYVYVCTGVYAYQGQRLALPSSLFFEKNFLSCSLLDLLGRMASEPKGSLPTTGITTGCYHTQIKNIYLVRACGWGCHKACVEVRELVVGVSSPATAWDLEASLDHWSLASSLSAEPFHWPSPSCF